MNLARTSAFGTTSAAPRRACGSVFLLLTFFVTGCHRGEAEGTTAQVTTESSDRACGSRGLAPCGEGEFCHFSVDAECGATDRPGHCAALPTICQRDYRPVCGCDGRTYPNSCQAMAAGVSVAREGACAEVPDGQVAGDCVRDGCGGELCRGTEEDSMASICLVREEHACFRAAACERQPDGRCGFTSTDELRACLANPPRP